MRHFRHYFFLTILVTGTALADITRLDVELSARHDNNVSGAESDRDIMTDNILALDVRAARSLMLSTNSDLLLRVMGNLTQFQHIDDLSHVDVGAGASYRIQPVKAYTAPWFEVGIGLLRQNYLGSDIRDGNVLMLDASIGKRFTDKLRVSGGLGWERRTADDNEVFDWNRSKLFAAADFRFSPDITLYTRYSRAYGDQVFTASPAPAFLRVAKAIIYDPASGLNAYRLNAIGNVFEFGSSYSLNPKSTLDVGVRYFQIEASGDHAYDGADFRMSWLYRFQ